MDAPELRLPEGVGFKVGGDTDIQWLVLQVHYKDVSSFLPPRESQQLPQYVLGQNARARATAPVEIALVEKVIVMFFSLITRFVMEAL